MPRGAAYARRMNGADENVERENPAAGRPRSEPLTDDELIRKDVSYSPASEAETAAKQDGSLPEEVDDDIDASRVKTVPGTGGPDDTGDVEVDPDELNMPHNPS